MSRSVPIITLPQELAERFWRVDPVNAPEYLRNLERHIEEAVDVRFAPEVSPQRLYTILELLCLAEELMDEMDVPKLEDG